jgi:outer membrane protein OmpA-like peptidoglycan-associated protein
MTVGQTISIHPRWSDDTIGNIRLPTGARHKIVIHRLRAYHLATGIFDYSTNDLLPNSHHAEGSQLPKRSSMSTLFGGVIALVEFAGQNPTLPLVLISHVSSPPGTSGFESSETRARMLRALLKQDFNEAANLARTRYSERDRVRLLEFAAEHFGWPCRAAKGFRDPQARSIFARCFSSHFGRSVEGSDESACDEALTFALTDCLERTLLARELDIRRVKLDTAFGEGGLATLDPRSIDCSESARPYVSSERIDIVFFDPEQLGSYPTLPVHRLYNSKIVRHDRVPYTEVDGVKLNAELKVLVVDMEDVNFHFNSCVFLPQASEEAENVDQRRHSGIAAIRAIYRHAKEHPELCLLCVGHTDRVGDPSTNKMISARRADNLRFVLNDDGESWAAQCHEHHRVQDYQLILTFIARHFAYPCDPGGVDGVHGSATESAITGFRTAFGREFGDELGNGNLGRNDWRAFFHVFSTILKPDRAGVQLQWATPATLACGESYPIDDPDAPNRRSTVNRRVEVLFCRAEDVPALTCDPPGSGIYGPDSICQRSYLDLRGPNDGSLELQLFPSAGYVPPNGARFRLVSSDGSIDRTAALWADCVDCTEYRTLTFTNLDRSASYTLWSEDDQQPVDVFAEIGYEALARLSNRRFEEDDENNDFWPMDGEDTETGRDIFTVLPPESEES